MFAASIYFSVGLSIIFADVTVVNGETEEEKCEKQTSYAVLSNAQSLTVNLFYDASKDLGTDLGFIWAMCVARETFTSENFNFFVGASVKTGHKGIECRHTDKNNKDCTDNIEHACAYKIIFNNFQNFVCCTNDGTPASQCLNEIDHTKKKEYDLCIQLQPPYKPDQVLLNTAKAAKAADPKGKAFPVLTFNGNNADPCASYIFYKDPVKAVCIILANCD